MSTALDRIEAGIDRWRQRLSVRHRVGIILVLTVLGFGAALFAPRLPQPLAYHLFADARSCFGIPNFFNTASNLAFLVVGLWGILVLRRPRPGMFSRPEEVLPYLVLFGGIAFVCFGSMWYHLAPDNDRLFWDRLPMVISFGALIGAIVGERIGPRYMRPTLHAAMAAGVATLVYWWASERAGAGNLIPYALFQAYSILVALLVLALFPSPYSGGRELLVGLVFYGMAKVAESLDEAIFAFGQVVSGHTLKHLLAAIGVAFILRMLTRRHLNP